MDVCKLVDLDNNFKESKLEEVKTQLASKDLKTPKFLFAFAEIKEKLLTVISLIEDLVRFSRLKELSGQKEEIDQASVSLCRNIFEAQVQLTAIRPRANDSVNAKAYEFLASRYNALFDFIDQFIKKGFEDDIENIAKKELLDRQDQNDSNLNTFVATIKRSEDLPEALLIDLGSTLQDYIFNEILPKLESLGITPVKAINIVCSSLGKQKKTAITIKEIDFFVANKQLDQELLSRFDQDLDPIIQAAIREKLQRFFDQRIAPLEFQNLEFCFTAEDKFNDEVSVSKGIRKESTDAIKFELAKRIKTELFKPGGIIDQSREAEINRPIQLEATYFIKNKKPSFDYRLIFEDDEPSESSAVEVDRFAFMNQCVTGVQDELDQFVQKKFYPAIDPIFQSWINGPFQKWHSSLDEGTKNKFKSLTYKASFKN